MPANSSGTIGALNFTDQHPIHEYRVGRQKGDT